MAGGDPLVEQRRALYGAELGDADEVEAEREGVRLGEARQLGRVVRRNDGRGRSGEQRRAHGLRTAQCA